MDVTRVDPNPNPVRPIARLSEVLINQIAAGEVVERPASVVKELVENSLDAGSTRIDVFLKEGGIEEISILDNGHGIHKDQMELAVERHTTSKLRAASDLEAISTFGFRGEALSSISSVSEVALKSRQQESAEGYVLELSFGERVGSLRPVGMSAGTQITVQHLFEKVPARQKFLRSVATEFSHCSKTLKEIALGNPQTAFYLHHQGNLSSHWVCSDAASRFQECLKPKWKPLEIHEGHDAFHLEAYLTPSDWSDDRGELFFFINQRPVRNRSLLSAIRQAYAQTLGPHHDPSGAIFLEIRKDWVDVNVHPQKLEVRCLKQETLYSWLTSVVRKHLGSAKVIREIPQPVSTPVAAFSIPTPLSSVPYVPKSYSVPVTQAPLAPKAPAPTQTSLFHSLPEVTVQSQMNYLGQAKAAYLICEDKEGVVLVDQHALHEKLAYEKLLKDHESQKLSTQSLLVPLVIHLAADLLPVLEENLKVFSEYGLEIEPFGDGDIAVKSRPALLPENQIEPVLKESLEKIRDGKTLKGETSELQSSFQRLLATMACHSVVRAGQSLSRTEAMNLLSGLDKIEAGWTCPHGRPVALRLSYDKISKHFERT